VHPHMYEIAQTFGKPGIDLVAVPEFAGPFGIADLAVVATTQDRLAARTNAEIEPIVHELDAAIVAHLTPRRGKQSRELAELLSVHNVEVERRVTHLARVGAVRRTRSGRLVRHEALAPLGRIFSVESKVAAWRQAFDQARTYALWSDRSIAVLGRLPADRTRAVAEARFAGIGLALGSEWLVRPKATHNSLARRLWTSELFFAALSQPES